MAKDADWNDRTVTSGFKNRDSEDFFRLEMNRTYIVRLPGRPKEQLTHWIDDVLDPKPDGSPRGFGMACAKVWDKAKEEWTGKCHLCFVKDEDGKYKYDTLKKKWAVGVVVLAVKRGEKPWRKIPLSESVKVWRIGNDKYTAFRAISDSLKSGKKKLLAEIELEVSLADNSPDSLGFQKARIIPSQAEEFCTAKHIKHWKAEAPDLLAEAMKVETKEEMIRALKPRKKGDKKRRDDDDSDEKMPAKKFKSDKLQKSGKKFKKKFKKSSEEDEIEALLK